jgi:hypothetical protein
MRKITGEDVGGRGERRAERNKGEVNNDAAAK